MPGEQGPLPISYAIASGQRRHRRCLEWIPPWSSTCASRHRIVPRFQVGLAVDLRGDGRFKSLADLADDSAKLCIMNHHHRCKELYQYVDDWGGGQRSGTKGTLTMTLSWASRTEFVAAPFACPPTHAATETWD